MKDFISLKILDKFRLFFEKIDVDYYTMRKVLQVKLTMDGRRLPTIMSNSSKQKKYLFSENRNNFTLSLLTYGLFSLIFIPFLLMKNNFIFQMSFVFGFLMFMLMTSLISDFSSVLLDIKDKNIIYSKPIEAKTLNMAKFIHISIYMFSITFALTGIPLIVALICHGIMFFLLFLSEIILLDLFVIVITALLYLLILKFFDGEKLKDIINYVQIILAITIAVGYQLLSRLFDFINFNVIFTPKWWQYFIIPTWFAAPFELILQKNYNFNYILFSVLAIIVPIISFAIYLKMIPQFENNLQKLNNNVESKRADATYVNKISKILCFTKMENTFFRFANNMMKNERQFKLKVYPSIGFAVALPFILLFDSLRSNSFFNPSSSKLYLSIYFCLLMFPTAMMMIKYSENYKAAWLYKALPIKETSDIYRGTFKAFIVKIVVPIFMFESLIFIGIFGVRITPDLILVFLNMMFYVVICFKAFPKALPFSEAFGTQQGENVIIIPMMLLMFILAAIHFISTFFRYGVLIFITIILIIDILAWRKAFNTVI
jgi:hypothetical protein